jgi:hypothetical protein
MKKFTALFVLLFCSLSFAQTQNWKGYLDTNIVWLNDATTKKYSKVYNQTEGVAMSLTIMANDTIAVRLGADSTRLCYGFQVGGPVLNSLGKMDTAWGPLDTLDTLSRNGYGANQGGGRYSITTDCITETWGSVDTLSVTGYAVQTHPVRSYNWDVYIRFWVVGMSGISTVTYNKVIIAVRRMTAVPTTAR